MELDIEGRQAYANLHNNVLTVKIIPKPYSVMCYSVCRALEDSEILELLGDKNQDMTLEQILRFIEAKEAGKRSAT